MAGPDPRHPMSELNPAGKLLSHLVASGAVTQEQLDISKKPVACFKNFLRQQQIADIEAEIDQKNLEIELLRLEKDTRDIVHPYFLAQKCHHLQRMNDHLEAVLKEKQSLRQRLLKPRCQENLPLEAVYHRHIVHLLELAISFIEGLESHLETIRNIPNFNRNLKKISMALAKMDILLTETVELGENIVKWREEQNAISSCISQHIKENHPHQYVTMPPLTFT
ncbi:HAUS augmin-like complex subunit 2 [Suncus etruscus]|uniref:HAUS augmin-like complex subunit 2 n=1 Tax=Suncus etruscus TaxID=109475 RepID=UPI00210FCB5A|nr:HAUS augmin-like complex subunit 2 [Suncus etruscus]